MQAAVDDPERGRWSGPPIDAELAIKQFSVPAGFKIDLFAAEPQLQNPVSFCFDEQGRVFVAETFRYKTSVFDIRDHMRMYYDDLACRTVDDRVAMIKLYLGDRASELAVQSEVVQVLEDRAGTGRADHAQVFADGFNTMLDGIGAGVLARKGAVYYADIPNLWMLRETNAAGRAGVRTSLSYGYGVHFGYTGHDLHGLRVGPDGKLYFSGGDRGLSVKTKEGKLLDYSETGTVLRCNLDGSDLEVVAYGLRNPQELAFDDHGNLFTGDNNCDHGDAARLVYVVEGGDCGWRNAYQFSETTPAGLWNSENLWELQFPQQAAYVVPPVGHLGDGPSGLAHYPGTGFPDNYRDNFFMCDFRGGSAISGVHNFVLNPRGAGFELGDHDHFFWHILATDVEFSPDGRMFVSDWVRGWPQSALGRLYRAYDPSLVKSALVLETKKLIAEGMEKREGGELETLLGHADQRVRQEAQFEIVDRALKAALSPEVGRKYVDALVRAALTNNNPLGRLHGIWGVGQIGRSSSQVMTAILPLLNDRDSEVRAQTAKVLGDARLAAAFAGLTNLLADVSLRVRFFAAQSLGKLGDKGAAPPLLEMLRANEDQDVFLRHAGVMGLLGAADNAALVAAAKDDSRAVRMAVLLAMRRRQLPEVAGFLHDRDPLIVLEAARAINDLPIREALPQLASLIEQPTGWEMLDWRIVNANFRVGGETNAAALAGYALKSGAPEKQRAEAVRELASWGKPFPRDRVTGQWRPLPGRDGAVAAAALQPALNQLVRTGPDSVRLMAVVAVFQLAMTNAAPLLLETVKDTGAPSDVRVAALKVMTKFEDPHLPEVAKLAMADHDEDVRNEGNRLQAELKPEDAANTYATVLEKGTLSERQNAFATLGKMEVEGADKLLAEWVDKLIAGKVPKEIQFDLLEAAGGRASTLVKDKLRQYQGRQPRNDEFAGFRETLYGGNAAAGRKIFLERPDVSCVRCHKVNGVGGMVGPELTGIITRHDREYILESILFPNKQISPGYDSMLVEMKNGQSYAGIVKSQDDQELNLLSVEDNAIVKLKKSDIKTEVRGQSPMPEGMDKILSKQDLRNLVEFLATLK